MAKRLNIILLFIYFLFNTSFSHGQKIDSLRAKIKSDRTDTAKVRLLLNMGNIYSNTDLDSTIYFFKAALIISVRANSKKHIATSLNHLGISYAKKNIYNNAIMCFNNALKINQQIGYLKGISDSYCNIGILNDLQGNYSKTLECYKKVMAIAQQTNDKEALSNCYNNIGVTYSTQGKYYEALKYLQKSTLIAEELNNYKTLSSNYNNMGAIFGMTGNYKKALEYYQKSVKICESTNNKEDLSKAYSNIGHVFDSQKKYNEALTFYKKALTIIQDIKNRMEQADCYFNIGSIYREIEYPIEALIYIQKALILYKEMNNKAGVSNCDNSLSELFLKQKNYKQAIIYATEALDIANEIGTLEQKQKACHILSTAYDNLGFPDKALKYFKLYSEKKDSLINKESQKKIIEMESKFQNEKKEKENQLLLKTNELQEVQLKRRSIIIYSVLSCTAIALFLMFIIFYLYNQKQKAYKLLYSQNELIEKQKRDLINEKIISDNILLKILPDNIINEIKINGKVTSEHYKMLSDLFFRLQSEKMHSQYEVLKNQINPHFLFNSLNVLSELVHTNADLSEQFIDKLSKAFMYVLKQKDMELTRLETELEFLQSYTFLMKIRFEDKIIFDINIDGYKKQLYIPPLTLQILVENAIKHNSVSKENPLFIKLYAEEDFLIVKNNYMPLKEKVISTGIGLQNIMSRFKFFTDKAVEYGVAEEYFFIKIPLINLVKSEKETIF